MDRNLSRAASALLAGFLLSGCGVVSDPAPTRQLPDVAQATVVEVVDGDTIHVISSGRRMKVRLIGLDAPEYTKSVEPLGREASEFAEEALGGTSVWLETDIERRDRYGRELAYVWLVRPESRSEAEVLAKMFNARIIAQGYAEAREYPPNTRYTDALATAESEAKRSGAGLWAPR